MFILDSLLVGGLRFVLDKVAAAADAEMQDDSALREQLLEAEMRLELGELTREEFAGIERDLLARIREIKGTRDGGMVSMSDEVTVDVERFDEREQPAASMTHATPFLSLAPTPGGVAARGRRAGGWIR
jgi:hypothetical protein